MQLRVSVLSLLCAGLLALPATAAPAQADGNPDSTQILNALTPHAGMSTGTRGIRPVAPSTLPPPVTPDGADAPARPHAPHRLARNTPAETPSVDLTVQFANGSAELTPAAMRTLDALGRALADPKLAGDKFRIEGHTDTLGAPDTNKLLSDQRARSVVAYLVSRFHVPADSLQPVGMGEDGLLVATGPSHAEPRNRRVVVVNLSA